VVFYSQSITISGIVKGIKEQLTATNCPQIAGKESATTKSGKGQRRKKYGMKVAVISSPLTKK